MTTSRWRRAVARSFAAASIARIRSTVSRSSAATSASAASSRLTDGPLDSYDDVLRNDNALFMRYRRELIERGVFEMPESLGRSHISAAHTTDDIDRSLEAAEDALRAAVSAGERVRF
jgi:glutamate-1-semialdehyde aminotransferase